MSQHSVKFKQYNPNLTPKAFQSNVDFNKPFLAKGCKKHCTAQHTASVPKMPLSSSVPRKFWPSQCFISPFPSLTMGCRSQRFVATMHPLLEPSAPHTHPPPQYDSFSCIEWSTCSLYLSIYQCHPTLSKSLQCIFDVLLCPLEHWGGGICIVKV